MLNNYIKIKNKEEANINNKKKINIIHYKLRVKFGYTLNNKITENIEISYVEQMSFFKKIFMIVSVK